MDLAYNCYNDLNELVCYKSGKRVASDGNVNCRLCFENDSYCGNGGQYIRNDYFKNISCSDIMVVLPGRSDKHF
ncbi:hypothetical protein H8356DRAFT_1321590 [Neocallimastix lanati (nom. inval.)]|nr:hypothetical protein H8356DRAFT_1321590 [Neocallimastix sp. JGI-2020a]